MGEWINQLWSIQTVDYARLKRNELSSHGKTWWTVKCILLSTGSQSEKGYVLCDFNYVTFWKTTVRVKRSVVVGSGSGTKGLNIEDF